MSQTHQHASLMSFFLLKRIVRATVRIETALENIAARLVGNVILIEMTQ